MGGTPSVTESYGSDIDVAGSPWRITEAPRRVPTWAFQVAGCPDELSSVSRAHPRPPQFDTCVALGTVRTGQKSEFEPTNQLQGLR
jgi:hypothetical protein